MNRNRLIFRKLQLSDTDLYHRLTGDEEVMRWIVGRAFSRTDSERDVARLVSKYGNDEICGVWVVTDRDTQSVIGTGGLIPMDSGDLGIGYRVLRQFWRQGYGTEICQELMRIAESGVRARRSQPVSNT